MKKRSRVGKKSTTSKTTRRASSRQSTSQVLLFPFSFRRIVLVTTALTLFLVGVVLFNRHQITQSVAGISIARDLFAQARVDIPRTDGATSYNIYYREQSTNTYTNVARDIPASTQSYIISYLKKGEKYFYKIAAVNSQGAEFFWTNDTVLTNIEPM